MVVSTSRGYSSYRGRKPTGKIILAIVLVVVIVASGVFLALQKYLVYDESGKPHWQFPGQSQSEPAASAQSAASSQDLKITIDQPKKTDVTGAQFSATPADWPAEAEKLGASDSFCVTMKDADGRLQYASAVSGAFLSDTAADASVELPALLKAHSGIARISCFRDGLYAQANLEAAGLKNTGGYIFYDGNNEQWLDPAKPAATAYLCAVIKECAGLGFQNILLTDVTYPTAGKLSKIDYGANLKNDNLIAFLKAARTALEGTDARLCLELPSDVITAGSDANAGLVLDDVAPLADAIYAQTTERDASALAQAVKDASADTDFVPEVSAALSDGSACLVVNP